MRSKPFLVLALFGLAFAALAWGQVPQLTPGPTADPDKAAPMPAATPGSAQAEMTAADVGAFLDGIIPLQLDRDNIAGATVAVVKDGQVLFAKGYGYADREKKLPVLPDQTMFRPGSISKLFTWTAVMQLYEQGKLDLDRDVNEYLDFKIPDAFGQPITLKHLLTHTPGFEEQVKDLFKADGGSPDLGQHLKTHIPARIFPPGTTPAYSNYGTALAGYIVERVSGRPFNDYIAENIFKPLGMEHSTFAQPLPTELAGNMSSGYRLASDPPMPFEVVTVFPAGSLSSTANDMTRFMIAHLKEGQFGDARILKPETARLMHSRLFALDDNANAMAYGFYEESRNGKRIIGHGGDTIAFHSDLHLIPETGVGFFISYNSAGKGEVSGRSMLWEAFLDRYYPFTADAQPLASAKEDAAKVAGSYMVSRRSETSFLRAAAVLGEVAVSVNEDGTISAAGLTDPNGLPKRWQEVAPMQFRDVRGQDTLIFKPDAEGRMQMIMHYPFMVFKRVGLFENSSILLPVLAVSLGIMLLTLVLTPIAWLVRRHYGTRLELGRLDGWLRRGIWIVFGLNLIFIGGLVGLLTYALQNLDLLSDSGNKWFFLFQAIGILGSLGTLVVLANAVRAWLSKGKSIWGKLSATVLVLACFGLLWFAYVANLLIMRSTY
ncbi:MAG: serine hydrolase domain-containing protein [Pyrinomonadaceae bacterium]